MTRQEIFEHAKSLPPEEREDLIADLQELSEASEFSAEQMAELDRRILAYKRGDVRMIPGKR